MHPGFHYDRVIKLAAAEKRLLFYKFSQFHFPGIRAILVPANIKKGGILIKAKSHHILGEYLLDRYMPQAPRRYARAFLLGCVEPDKNPATYLKGSLRCQWLRGHNWGNAQRYMGRVCARLERREKLRLLDYYTLGKLIHYTTDAFTWAHNDFFSADLKGHCDYERLLQSYFTRYLPTVRQLKTSQHSSLMETILAYHRDYTAMPRGIHTDAKCSIRACSAVLALLLSNHARTIPTPGL